RAWAARKTSRFTEALPVAAIARKTLWRSSVRNSRRYQVIFPAAASFATSDLAWGATTVMCAPVRSREAILEVAIAPAPTTRQGRFSSLMKAGNNSEDILVSHSVRDGAGGQIARDGCDDGAGELGAEGAVGMAREIRA